MTISLSLRAVALKLLTAVPKNPSTKGTCLPPTFTHHSECYLQNLFFYKSLKTPNRALGYSHRRQVLTRFRASIGSTPLFCVPCIYSHLADVVCRVLPIWASIVGATRLDVLLVILHLCHTFSFDGWYTIFFRRLPTLEKNPCQGIP